MLNEPSFVPQKVGWIEVISGGMFSGKTEELIRRAKRAGQCVTKLHAVCAESGAMAHYSQRVVESRDRVLVGEAEAYEPRARHCYRPPVDKRRGKPITPIKKQESAETEEDNEQ